MSFKEVALAVHELNAPSYRNKKYAAQWLSSIENHVLPVLGTKSIGSITSSDILSVLSPIWSDKHDTAKKNEHILPDGLWKSERHLQPPDIGTACQNANWRTLKFAAHNLNIG
jgi:hypothetical protein